MRVAEALGVSPTSGDFRTLASAAEVYGLTVGAAYAEHISLSPLGRRAVAPTTENDDLSAKREAFLRPRVVREFLTKYDGSKLPEDRIASNVLEELGVPAEACARAINLIREGAQELGLLRSMKGGFWVDLAAADGIPATDEADRKSPDDSTDIDDPTGRTASRKPEPALPASLNENKRIYVTHGSNKKIVDQLKELVTYGSLVPVVTEERETTAKPVSKKVMDDMRSCGAAIIHVGSEEKLLDAAGAERTVLNENVLIEIGAAMALYADKFILLVERGAKLPSNLQGLYEVRYEGERLDYEATMKLLKALSQLRGDSTS
jgi:predicted nucleotide-binding protein